MGSRRDSANRQSTANDRSGCHICYCWIPCCCDCCCGSGERQQPSRQSPIQAAVDAAPLYQCKPRRLGVHRRTLLASAEVRASQSTHQTSRLGRLVRTFHALPRIFHGRPLHRAPRAGTMTLYPRLHPLPPSGDVILDR